MKILSKNEFIDQLKKCLIDTEGKMNGVAVYVNEDGDIDCGAGLNQGDVFRIEFLRYDTYSDICGSDVSDITHDDFVECVMYAFIDEIYDYYIDAIEKYEIES